MRDVEVAHGAVVVAPRHLQLILELGDLILQREEILVGLELRIGLGDGEQPAQRALQLVLGGGLAGDVGGVHRRGAFRRDLLEQAALVGGVGLHRLDEIGNEVAAPPQLDVDAAQALAHEIAPADQAVEHRQSRRARSAASTAMTIHSVRIDGLFSFPLAPEWRAEGLASARRHD